MRFIMGRFWGQSPSHVPHLTHLLARFSGAISSRYFSLIAAS